MSLQLVQYLSYDFLLARDESALKPSLQKCCDSMSKVLPREVSRLFSSVEFAYFHPGELSAEGGHGLKY